MEVCYEIELLLRDFNEEQLGNLIANFLYGFLNII